MTAALDSDLPVGKGELVAGKYRVEAVIGAGGMGYVVAATHVQLLQKVAIKFLHPAADADSATRLMREARAAVALSSDHVARVLDVGSLPSGAPYIVMEYLEGQTLASRLSSRGALDVPQVVMVAKQACIALGEAHRAGIVHRDVKPANIFLARRDGKDVVKVLDFGIAKVSDPRVSVQPEITSTSQVLGTPRYMSPEQLSSTRDVGPETDVWALGVTMYECLTGKPAFQTGSAYEVGARILSSEPAKLHTLRSDVPPTLIAIIEKCLKKVPAERYANADELLAALEGRLYTPVEMPAPAGLASEREVAHAAAQSPPETRVAPPRVVQKRTLPLGQDHGAGAAVAAAAAAGRIAVAQDAHVAHDAQTTKETRKTRMLAVVAALLVAASVMSLIALIVARGPGASTATAASTPSANASSAQAEEPTATPVSSQATAAPEMTAPGMSVATPPEPAASSAPPSLPTSAPQTAPSPSPAAAKRPATMPRKTPPTLAPAPKPTAITRPPDER